MKSFELHMTSLPLFMISHHAMTSHPLYSCHHTQDTCHRIHCSWTITYSVLIIPYLLYVWHQTPYMCVLYEFYIFYRNSILHHTHSLWHNNTVFMTSHPLYSWQHTHSIWHYILYTCDIKATVSMTNTSYGYDINVSIYDLSHGVLVATQPRYPPSHSQYLCNHTHLIDDITQNVCINLTVSPGPDPSYFSVLCHRVLVSLAKPETPLIRFALETRNPDILGSSCLFLLTRAVFFWPTRVRELWWKLCENSQWEFSIWPTGIDSPKHTHTDI